VAVNIGAAAEGAARTIAPALTSFATFTLAFSGPEAVEPVDTTLDGGPVVVDLAPGLWTISATGYAASGAAVAEGSAQATVAAGDNEVVILLGPKTGGAEGTFSYSLKIPSGLNTAQLIIATEGGDPVETINLSYNASGITGSRNLNPGQYLARVRLRKGTGLDSVYAGFIEALHIYSGLESALPHREFTDDDFMTTVSALDLTGLVRAPALWGEPLATLTENPSYTGSVAWKESNGVTPVSGVFEAGRVYKAVATLTAAAGYTFAGVAENSFTYSGAAAANAIDSGVVIITFPVIPPYTGPVDSIDYAAYDSDTGFETALRYLLEKAAPEENSPGDPLPLKVKGLDLSTKLSVLTGALTRYVSLDLSECTVSTPGSQMPGQPVVWSRLDLKKSGRVVGMILPAAVINLNLQISPLMTIAMAYENLSSFTAPGLTQIGHSVFEDLPYLKRVELPALQVMVGEVVFSGCVSLTTVIIPSAETISKGAFKNCTALETIDIEAGQLRSVGSLAFEGANTAFDFEVGSPLTWNTETRQLIRADEDTVTLLAWLQDDRDPNSGIPVNVTKIGDSLFSGMTNITSVTLPASITAIGSDAFADCSSLTQAVLPGVTELGEWAFGNSGLVAVNFPEVRYVGEMAFQYCLSLESVNLPKAVTIGEGAFINGSYYGDPGKLASVNLGDSLETIGRHAFIYCAKLESLVLPATVTHIGEQAFGASCGIKTLTVKAITPPSVEHSLYGLFGAGSIETIYVPAGSVAAYQAAPEWEEYALLITAIE
jgi:hypothetical protein